MHDELSPERPVDTYDEEYYRTGCGPFPYERSAPWLATFRRMAEELVRSLRPGRVLDAGCALGMLVESLWDLGVFAKGIDISEFAIANVRRDMQPYCRVGSLVEPLNERFDVIACIEVLEHMSGDDSSAAMRTMAEATDVILFSSTPDDFSEPTHVNVKPPLAWLSEWAKFGFFPDVTYDASYIAPQAMLLRRCDPLPEPYMMLYASRVRLACDLFAAKSQSEKLLDTARTELESEQSRSTHLEGLVADMRDELERLRSLNAELERSRTTASQWLEDERHRTATLEQSHAEALRDLRSHTAVVEEKLDEAIARVEFLEAALREAEQARQNERAARDEENAQRSQLLVAGFEGKMSVLMQQLARSIERESEADRERVRLAEELDRVQHETAEQAALIRAQQERISQDQADKQSQLLVAGLERKMSILMQQLARSIERESEADRERVRLAEELDRVQHETAEQAALIRSHQERILQLQADNVALDGLAETNERLRISHEENRHLLRVLQRQRARLEEISIDYKRVVIECKLALIAALDQTQTRRSRLLEEIASTLTSDARIGLARVARLVRQARANAQLVIPEIRNLRR